MTAGAFERHDRALWRLGEINRQLSRLAEARDTYQRFRGIEPNVEMEESTMVNSYKAAPDIEILTSNFPIPGFGLVPINAFVIKGSEPVLVDTGAVVESAEFMSALRSVIDPADLKWIWLTHTDADHIGSLHRLLAENPQIRVITTFLGVGIMSLSAPLPMNRVYLVNPGQTKATRLGMPLPKGVVRVYKLDRAGQPQFIGEDRIDHTPENETVRLKLGEAFDVTATRKQTDFRKLGGDGRYNYRFESAFEIQLKNAKDEAVSVTVVEPVPGDWRVLTESQKHRKGAANAAVWAVPVPAKGETTLTYRVEVNY